MQFQLYNQLRVMHGENECRLSHDNRSSDLEAKHLGD
jgi:hypothetical protein